MKWALAQYMINDKNFITKGEEETFVDLTSVLKNGLTFRKNTEGYEKSCDFYKLFYVHSYSTKEAQVDKGDHLFF